MKLENKIEVTLTKTITNKDINYFMCTCFEGGSGYWVKKVEVTNGDYKGGKYASDVIGLGGMLEIVTEDSRILIDKNCIVRALNHLNNIGYRKVLERLLNEQYDAIDTDILLQVACFDDVLYG